jgi:V/A-type H+-transporting ATPase subunit E
MSLDKVVEDILRKGEEKKREIIRQGEQERDQVLHQAKADAEASREKADRQFQVTVSQMEQQELSSAELESKRLLLAAQRRVMEDLKHQALQELAHLPAERRKPLYDKLVAKAQKELGACYVYSTEACSSCPRAWRTAAPSSAQAGSCSRPRTGASGWITGSRA